MRARQSLRWRCNSWLALHATTNCAQKKAKKRKTPTKKSSPKKSEIIKHCVIYAQSIAAYNAGFKVDHTGDSDHAGCDGLGKEYLDKAAHALRRLLALSPAFPNGEPMTTRRTLHQGWRAWHDGDGGFVP
jgi:hypothetical protein